MVSGAFWLPRAAAPLERLGGFNAADAHDSMMAVGRYVVGWVLFEQGTDDLDREHGFEFGLQAMLTGLGQRPAVSAA